LGGFGATVQRPGRNHGRYGLWGSDQENASSNYRELLSLVETIEEKAIQGAESCFVKVSSMSQTLHELVLRLRKIEMDCDMTIFLVHCAGTRMISQGTCGLSIGSLLEGVFAGQDMLSFINISKPATDRYPPILDYINSWAGNHPLSPCCLKNGSLKGMGLLVAPRIEMKFGFLATVKLDLRLCGPHPQ